MANIIERPYDTVFILLKNQDGTVQRIAMDNVFPMRLTIEAETTSQPGPSGLFVQTRPTGAITTELSAFGRRVLGDELEQLLDELHPAAIYLRPFDGPDVIHRLICGDSGEYNATACGDAPSPGAILSRKAVKALDSIATTCQGCRWADRYGAAAPGKPQFLPVEAWSAIADLHRPGMLHWLPFAFEQGSTTVLTACLRTYPAANILSAYGILQRLKQDGWCAACARTLDDATGRD